MKIDFFLAPKKTFQYINLTIEPDTSPFPEQQKLTLSTPLIIETEDWNNEKQRPNNIYLKKHKGINAKLDELKIWITEYSTRKIKTGKPLSQKTMLREINKTCRQKIAKYPELSLLHFIQMYIDEKKDMISHSTFKRYKVFFHLIQKFEGYLKKRIFVDTLNSSFIKNFIVFGRQETYSENTIYRSLNFVRTILNFVERKGIRTAVRELEVKREKQRHSAVTLSEKEILSIKTAQLPQELQATKDWLLISCYTGQRISDFMNFSKQNILEIEGRTCIHFIQQKTGKSMLLPLHPIVLNVIRRNGGNFPRKIDPVTYNQQIKIVAKIAGLNSEVNTKIRIGFRALSQCIEKWQSLTSHIGRRSFATFFYGKIPTPLLMEATGHSTEQMFLKYINPTDHSRIVSLSRYFDKMYKKRNE